MILTAHQPNYLPYPGLFQKIAAADAFLVVDTTQFVKRGPFGWIHRNRIRTPNGPIWLSLPVLHKGHYHQAIVDAKLNPRSDWQKKHWKSIEWNYGRSPHWERYAPGLREIYQQEWTHLAPVTTALIRWFLTQLELEPEILVASELESEGKSTDYIVAFCQELGADTFLSGVHGRDYLHETAFESAGIELRYQAYQPPRYSGTELEGNENLSMLDMLFWVGEDAKDWVREVQTPIAG